MVELVTRLPRDEFEPLVISLLPPPYFGGLADRLVASGIEVEYLNCKQKNWYPAAIKKLAARLGEVRPTLVQAFLHHANVAAALAAKRAGIRRVVTGIRVAERRWNLHRFAARLTDHLVVRHVCVSEAVAEFAATRTGLTKSKLVVIPNGVDVTRFAQAKPLDVQELGVPPGGRILAFVGRLDRQKRLHWLIQRIPEMIRRLPRHHLALIGQGPQKMRLGRLAARLGVAHHVHFAGWRDDIPRVLATADVVVLTSAWEGMPNVLLEAMAAARPVVATTAEGVSEILGPLSGHPARQLVDSHDVAAFVDSVTRLATDKLLANEVGLANRRRVEQLFTLEYMVQRYCGLYRELLADP
jgi:starch synthase (maltosyl-transferring)